MPAKKIPSDRLIELFPKFSPVTLRYKDVFDLKAFYEAFMEYLVDNDWFGVTNEGEKDLNHWETYYGEKIGRGGDKEIRMRWRPVKKPDGAPFLTYHLDVNFQILALMPVEIIKEGKKIKADKGEMEVVIKPFIEENYKYQFDKTGFLKPVKRLFSQKTYAKVLEQRKKELYQEIYALQNFIKQWFKMKRYLPYEEVEGFFRPQAWPSHIKEE